MPSGDHAALCTCRLATPCLNDEVNRYVNAIMAAEGLDREGRCRIGRSDLTLPTRIFGLKSVSQSREMKAFTDHPARVGQCLSFTVQDGPPDETLAGWPMRVVCTKTMCMSVSQTPRDLSKACPVSFLSRILSARGCIGIKGRGVPQSRRRQCRQIGKFHGGLLGQTEGDTVTRLLTSNIIVADRPFSCASCANEELGARDFRKT